MNQAKPYRSDTIFRAKARKHQSDFREKVLGIDFDIMDPRAKFGNLLPEEAALRGLIFFEGYRDEILKIAQKRYGYIKCRPLYSNLLRSEHIPLNIFGPMIFNPEKTKRFFGEIIKTEIKSISVTIEYAGENQPSHYLSDKTSFDAFISYNTKDGIKGGIGFEVKYTEEGYGVGRKEKEDIKKSEGVYQKRSFESGYYINPNDSQLKDDMLRQIWRNHLLGASMVIHTDIQTFQYVHLYPKGNTYIEKFAIPRYLNLLTDKGKQSFVGLTYEHFFELMKKHFTSEKEMAWIAYLIERYLFTS